ncbi:MAG: radical SAM protein [Elusimicrobia bacterium]|nr:radical SAM protein [Elusimicrobiota bacterium]
MRLRVGRIIERSRANGPGERFVVWVQGCVLRCPGCSNAAFSDPDGGEELDVRGLARRIARTPGLRGVTLSGGEPLLQAKAVSELLALLDPALDSVVFTGYDLEGARRCPARSRVLDRADAVIAGPFLRESASSAPAWAGSSNQTFHARTGRVLEQDWPERTLEVHIAPGGSVTLTGALPVGLRPVTREQPASKRRPHLTRL